MSYQFAHKHAETGAPLFYTFHGTGGDETQFHGLASELMPEASVISPRGDVSEHGANRFFKRTGEGVYDMDDLAQRAVAMAGFVEVQNALARPSKVIGLGYSNGANILASVVFQHPGLFDAIVLMHPLIPWQPQDNAALASARVLITAGQHDPICPVPLTNALSEYFERQGSDAQLVWNAGGHEVGQSELTAVQKFLQR